MRQKRRHPSQLHEGMSQSSGHVLVLTGEGANLFVLAAVGDGVQMDLVAVTGNGHHCPIRTDAHVVDCALVIEGGDEIHVWDGKDFDCLVIVADHETNVVIGMLGDDERVVDGPANGRLCNPAK